MLLLLLSFLLPPLLLPALISNLSSLLPFTSLLFHLLSCSLHVRHHRLLPLLHLDLLCLARGHSRPAHQVQYVRQRHRQVGVYAPPRSGPEGADSALRSAIGPWSRSHHEEPGGTDAAGLGNGRKDFLGNVSQYSLSFLHIRSPTRVMSQNMTKALAPSDVWLVTVNYSDTMRKVCRNLDGRTGSFQTPCTLMRLPNKPPNRVSCFTVAATVLP